MTRQSGCLSNTEWDSSRRMVPGADYVNNLKIINLVSLLNIMC